MKQRGASRFRGMKNEYVASVHIVGRQTCHWRFVIQLPPCMLGNSLVLGAPIEKTVLKLTALNDCQVVDRHMPFSDLEELFTAWMIYRCLRRDLIQRRGGSSRSHICWHLQELLSTRLQVQNEHHKDVKSSPTLWFKTNSDRETAVRRAGSLITSRVEPSTPLGRLACHLGKDFISTRRGWPASF